MATAAEIQAEAASLPQNQDALDTLLLKYSPAEMAAAFPQYGSAADYANAASEAAARTQQNAPAQQAAPSGPTLTAEQRDFITWQGQQINPANGRPISDTWASQGITDPFADPRLVNQAQEQIDRAGRREDVFAQAGIAPGDLRPWSDAPPPGSTTTVGGGNVGGGGFTTGPGGGVGIGPGPGGTTPAPGGGGGGTTPPPEALHRQLQYPQESKPFEIGTTPTWAAQTRRRKMTSTGFWPPAATQPVRSTQHCRSGD